MILLTFITKSEQLDNYINSGKIIYPEGFLTKRQERASCSSYLWKKTGDALLSVEKNITKNLHEVDGIIIFCDNSLYEEISGKIGYTVLVSKLGDYNQFLDGSVKTKQYLEDRITVALKVYFWMRESFNNGFGELLRLPIRNFNDNDFKKTCIKISQLLSSDTVFENLEDINKLLSMLKNKIRKPKKRPHTSTKFYVDEKKYYFEYGKEKHAQHETDPQKGHDHFCDFSARFRFSIKIEERKHFNVCKDDRENSSIQGTFENCHGEDTLISKRTHINMFSNDYIA
ncbi:hypothetical protein [Kosakonia cowanii]|uniref:hypothetical protein n=1 Tax=Kosakonia cowanii TaxID=208223 RepID=UPI0028AAB8EA|nr:hypothetical protein [Kosakonia cowanii]